jgi:hypothetical protein
MIYTSRELPKWICIVPHTTAMHMGAVPIDYFCEDSSHAHFKRKRVELMVQRGDLRWHGKHCRVAYWTEHRTWQKTPCHLVDQDAERVGTVAVMQWVKGAR